MRLIVVAIATIVVAADTKAESSLSMSSALFIGFLCGSTSVDGLEYLPRNHLDYETLQAGTTNTSKSPVQTKAGTKTSKSSPVQTKAGKKFTFTNNTVWSSFVVSQGKTVATETFNSYYGLYPNGHTGNAGGIQWTASAPGEVGGLYADLGFMSTNDGWLLTFNFSPSVKGVAGNFFATDFNFTILPANIGVQLADGTYVGYAASAADFVGFYSNGAAISSISVSVLGNFSVAGNLPPDNYYATADNLYFAV